MLWVVPLQAAIFFGSGMYRGIWRYASVPDLQRIAIAGGLSTSDDRPGVADAAASGTAGAALGDPARSDAADSVPGRQPARLSRMEGAPPAQRARLTRQCRW